MTLGSVSITAAASFFFAMLQSLSQVSMAVD